MVAVGLTRGGRLQESLTAGLWLERCLVLWIGIVVAWIMEGGGRRGGGETGVFDCTHSWLVGRYRDSINSQQVINFHVLIVSRISRRSVYFERFSGKFGIYLSPQNQS